MKTFLGLISVCIFILLLVMSLNSQVKEEMEQDPGVKFLLKEKMKISEEQVLEYLKTGKMPSNKISPRNKKIETQSFKEDLVSDDMNPESEVHAAINPKDSNNIIISPIRMDVFQQNPGEMLLCPIYYTKDFGKSWNKSTFKNKSLSSNIMTVGGGDPMLVFDKKGTAYLSWIHLNYKIKGTQIDSVLNSMHWAYSSNGGIDWKRESNDYVAKTGGKNLIEFYDKQWMACDYSNSQYSNNIYLSLTHMQVGSYNIKVYRKSGTDKEFKSAPVLANKSKYPISQFSNIEVDNKGYVHVLFYGTVNNSTNSLYHSVSKDGGKTFETERKISDFVFGGSQMLPSDPNEDFIGFNPQRLYPCPQMAIDKSGKSGDGNIYVTWTAIGITKNEGNALDIYLSKSTDAGATWSEPQIVNDDDKQTKTCQFYSNVSVNPNGTVILSWYDRREDQFDKYDRYGSYFMTFSFDNGKTFVKNFPVSTQKTDFATIGDMNNDFGVGEYNMLLSTKGYAIPVWSDGRTSDGDMNIYAAFVEIKNNPSGAIDNITTVNSGIYLHEPYPNPGTDKIKFGFNLHKNSLIKLFITDITGENIKEIAKNNFPSGDNYLETDISDFTSGIYFINIEANGAIASKKFIVKR